MTLSLIEKIGIIFKYTFSSFLSIEMLILTLLLFCVLIYNLKRKNQLVQMLSLGVYLGFVIGIIISYGAYVQTSVNSFVKAILNYIYFPSTVVYFFILVFVTIMILYTLFSKNITDLKKIINYLFFSIIYFFFMSFMALSAYDGVDLMDITNLYKNDTILSLVQMSNFLLVTWLLFTGFYYLYKYFKKRFDDSTTCQVLTK